MNFLMTVDQALEFYERCAKEGAVTLEERLAVMAVMVKERRAFEQTNEQVKRRLKSKKVLKIRPKDSNEPSNS